MLKELIDAWKSKDVLKSMMDQFGTMLSNADWMFTNACDVLLKKEKVENIKEELYAKDKEINKLQWTIRKQIVEHLTVRPGVDVVACLVLMSLVKDAERVGDYCKNIFEVSRMYTGNFDHGRYITPLQEIVEDIKGLFVIVKDAFESSDVAKAHQVTMKSEILTKKCDMVIGQLINDNLPTNKAVAYTLLSRYFKRVSAHLSNIATSVIAPVHKLDYVKDHVSKTDILR